MSYFVLVIRYNNFLFGRSIFYTFSEHETQEQPLRRQFFYEVIYIRVPIVMNIIKDISRKKKLKESEQIIALKRTVMSENIIHHYFSPKYILYDH